MRLDVVRSGLRHDSEGSGVLLELNESDRVDLMKVNETKQFVLLIEDRKVAWTRSSVDAPCRELGRRTARKTG